MVHWNPLTSPPYTLNRNPVSAVRVEVFGIGERLEAFLKVVQANLVTAPERPIPFDGPSAPRLDLSSASLKSSLK